MSIRVGLIGAGRMGKVYAHTLAFSVAEVDLAAVADADPKIAQETAARYGAKAWYADYRKLLEQKDIEAVVIATPTHTHVDVVKAAAASGKEIFCEKPLGMTLQGCDEAIEILQLTCIEQDIPIRQNSARVPSVRAEGAEFVITWPNGRART